MEPAAAAATAFVTFTLLLLAPLASAECRLPLTLNPELSLLTLGGGVVAPAQPLSLVHPEAAVGLRGALALVLLGACPADAAGLVSSLAGSRLETGAELGPLLLYPELVQAIAGSLAGVSLSGVAVNLTTTPLLEAAGQGGTFSATLDATLAGGTASLNASLLSPDPVPIVLLGLTASNATQVMASEQGGLARLQLQGLQLTFPYTLEVPGLPLQLSLEVVLNGTLVLETALGCPAECGSHGRCWVGGAGSNGTTAAAQPVQPAVPVCECECGWSGAGCAVPSGFCPLYPSQARLLAAGQAVATCPAVTVPSPATSAALGTPQQCPACITPDDCTARQTYDTATRACVCRPGWVGDECSACRTADACNAFYGVTGSTCSQQDFTFNPQSQLKVYSCNLQGLETLLRPAFTVSCNTSQPEAGDDKYGRYCQFDMSTAEGIPMTCLMSGCSFQPGSTRVDCTNVHCECASACPDFQPLINLAEGQPVVIDCNPSTQVCTTDIKDFLVVLSASCETAECLVQGYSLEGGSNVVASGQDYNVVIAAIPLMALVAATCACAFLLARHWPYWAALGSPPPGDEQALVGGEQALLTGQVHVQMRTGATPELLSFSQLSCSVPAQSSQRGANVAGHPAGSANGAGTAEKAEAPPARRWYNFWGGRGGSGGGGAGMKAVLCGVSGMARKGELVAVMGPSGCGKTTLLALLAGSAEYLSDGAQVEGAVMLDGVPLGSGARHKVAFVPQDDTLPSTLTVAECLTTHAMLRLPTWLTPAQVQAQVWRVIRELGLQHVAGSRVGGGLNGGRGLSGGERRRLTIGQELVSDPAILVLDEPTSGLDAYSALQLIRTLKQVASAGRIVLLSCHQPSPAMFNLIDRAYLLVAGTCVFGGPPAAVGAHFASHGLPCPPNTAAAEYMLEVVSNPRLLPQLLQSMQRSSHLESAGSELGCAKLDPDSSALPGEAVLLVLPHGGSPGVVLPQAGTVPLAASPPEKPLDGNGNGNGPHNLSAGGEPSQQALSSKVAPAPLPDHSVHSTGCHGTSRLARELAVVFGRTLADTLRNPSLLLLHWVLALAMGLLMGAIFWQVSLDVSGVQNRGGGAYFTLAFFAFTALTTTDVLTAERRLVMREVRGGYCRPLTYLLAKAMLDGLLLRVIPVFLYSVPFYYMMGLQTGATHVALFLFTVATFALAVAALSLAVAAACTTSGQASLLLTFIFLLSLLVGGFLVNVDSIPDWISWLRYLSIFYYAYGILTTNEVAGLRMEIAVEGYTAVADVRGLAVLSTFGIDASRLTTWIVVLDCLYAACLILALATLYLRMRRPAALRRQKVPSRPTKAGGAQPASGPDAAASLGV